jgi:hypothetical protein
MNALIAILALALCLTVSLTLPGGAAAVLFCVVISLVTGGMLSRLKEQRTFLIQLFVLGVLARMLVGALIYGFELQPFFGGDAEVYDVMGYGMMEFWRGNKIYKPMVDQWMSSGIGGWGMVYVIAAIYTFVGRNPLAVQFFNAVVGAATAPVIFLCAQHIFRSLRVARIAAIFVAFYPSLILWSSQGLKDGPIVFLLALVMLAILRLGEKLSVKHFTVLVLAMGGLLTLRFYILYMVAAAAGGAFLIGMRPVTSTSLIRQLAIVLGAGLALTYLGVLRPALQHTDMINLQMVQTSRADQAGAGSGFGQDVDVSTTSGALSVIPVGMAYLLFAPFPWQLANLRQSITLPEMIVWWASFPLLVLGIYFTLRWRFRQALPILLFTAMLTVAYSIFQGNVGTAYRQRSQLLVFYFIFVSVGFVLVRERQEERRRKLYEQKQARIASAQAMRVARRARDQWQLERNKEWEEVARELAEKVDG